MWIETFFLEEIFFCVLPAVFGGYSQLALAFLCGVFVSYCHWFTVERSRKRGEDFGKETRFKLLELLYGEDDES